MTQEELKRKYGDTLVMGVDAKTILPLLTDGLNPPDEAIADAIECNLKPMLRCEAEQNPAFEQIIPYIILMNMDGRIFTTLRLGGDERLKGQHSIGLGGHMDGGEDVLHCTVSRTEGRSRTDRSGRQGYPALRLHLQWQNRGGQRSRGCSISAEDGIFGGFLSGKGCVVWLLVQCS